MKNLLLGFMILLPSFSTRATVLDAAFCKSQLLRVSVSDKAFTGVSARTVLDLLKDVAPSIQDLLLTSFQIPTIDFPAFGDVCQKRKNDGDPLYRNIDCMKPGLCGDMSLDPVVRGKICFYVPCSILEGNLEVRKCNKIPVVYPVKIGFPSPLVIDKLELTPTTSDYNGNEATMCFQLKELSLKMSASITFDTTGTNLSSNKITIDNIAGVLDHPRDICIKTNVNLISNNILQNVRIIPQDAGPFITDQMLIDVAAGVKLSGVSGYNARDIEAVQRELLPTLLQPLRESIEGGVKEALGNVISDQIKNGLDSINPEIHGQPNFINSTAFMSELNYASTSMLNSLAYYECAHTVLAGKKIPQNHPCIGLTSRAKWVAGQPLPPEQPITINTGASFFLNNEWLGHDSIKFFSGYPNIAAESFRQRLLKLKKIFQSETAAPEYLAKQDITQIKAYRQSFIRAVLDPFIKQIEKNQLADTSLNLVEIQGDVTPGSSRNVGFSLPSMCSETTASPHANISIPNCPIQIFVDMNEFNKTLTTLWSSGRMCSYGKGETCGLPTDLIGCTLSNAPQLKYNAGRYSTSLKLRNCRKDFLPFGIFGTSLGGDFNINLNFKPKACHNGDFCIDDPRITWNLVNGSETGLLKDPFIRAKATDVINKAINGAMSTSLRIPLASATDGIIAKVPLRSEGRVRSGPGYFGVCLEQDRK